MLYAKEVIKFFLFLLFWTAIGPLKIKGQSLENHYHIFVNSDEFNHHYKTTMWTLARPLTWAGEKVTGLFASKESPNSAAQGR